MPNNTSQRGLFLSVPTTHYINALVCRCVLPATHLSQHRTAFLETSCFLNVSVQNTVSSRAFAAPVAVNSMHNVGCFITSQCFPRVGSLFVVAAGTAKLMCMQIGGQSVTKVDVYRYNLPKFTNTPHAEVDTTWSQCCGNLKNEASIIEITLVMIFSAI